MQLGLAARGRRGGYRENAGRPKGRSGHYVPHIKRPEVTKSRAVHVTLRCVAGLPSLRNPVAGPLIEKIFAREGSRKGFRLVHYAIRGNHLHLICEADETLALSRGIQRVCSRIALTLNRHWERKGRFFADRFHGQVIRSPRQMRNALRYVYLNEHKDKAKRHVRYVGCDPYTSYRWFEGWAPSPGVPKVRPPPLPEDPVTPAKSWLLTKGWLERGGGPIRTDEKAPSCP